MKLLTIVLLSVFTFLQPAVQDINALIKEADRLEILPDEQGAFLKYKEVLKLQSTNLHALSKCSELCSRIGQRQVDTKLRDDYYAAAKIYAETALKIDPLHSEANTSMAIMLGRTTLTKSGKEKVIAAKDLKKHVDAAIKTNPLNFLAWHVLGRWHYEISNLNFVERAAVKMFYGGFPPSSLKEGITAFEKSKQLMPGFILNYLELAKAYHRNDEDVKAKAILNQMMLLPNHTEDDITIKATGVKFLKEWE
jgi:tetratricopeptide (TPR) repeat protein